MMMMMKPLREHLSPFSWIQPHSKGASFTSYHIPVFKCSPSMMRGWMPKYSLPGRRKKGRGRGEKLERESQSLSFFPFLPILCPFRRLLLRLKYKTRLCPPFPPFPCPVFVFVLCPAGVARSALETERNLGSNWLGVCRSPFWFYTSSPKQENPINDASDRKCSTEGQLLVD